MVTCRHASPKQSGGCHACTCLRCISPTADSQSGGRIPSEPSRTLVTLPCSSPHSAVRAVAEAGGRRRGGVGLGGVGQRCGSEPLAQSCSTHGRRSSGRRALRKGGVLRLPSTWPSPPTASLARHSLAAHSVPPQPVPTPQQLQGGQVPAAGHDHRQRHQHAAQRLFQQVLVGRRGLTCSTWRHTAHAPISKRANARSGTHPAPQSAWVCRGSPAWVHGKASGSSVAQGPASGERSSTQRSRGPRTPFHCRPPPPARGSAPPSGRQASGNPVSRPASHPCQAPGRAAWRPQSAGSTFAAAPRHGRCRSRRSGCPLPGRHPPGWRSAPAGTRGDRGSDLLAAVQHQNGQPLRGPLSAPAPLQPRPTHLRERLVVGAWHARALAHHELGQGPLGGGRVASRASVPVAIPAQLGGLQQGGTYAGHSPLHSRDPTLSSGGSCASSHSSLGWMPSHMTAGGG